MNVRGPVEKWRRENPKPAGEPMIEVENLTQVAEVVSPNSAGEPRNAAASPDHDAAQVSGCVDGSAQENDGSD